jgi:antitoxin component of RelBE/YafQ-DinJ toxin-antitoxin module
MTPTDVKELLKALIAEECLPIDVVDMAPSQDLEAKYSTTEARIKDVINQWNKDGKIHVLPAGQPEIMEFYTKTDAASPTKELLESLAVEAFLESVIVEQELPIRFTDCGFRLITLTEDNTTRYPVKILHGGFRLEKRTGTEIESSQLEKAVNRFEAMLKRNGIKAKMFHRGFQLEKDGETEIPLSQVSKISEQIDTTLGINYVLNAYEYANRDEASATSWTSASICVSLWRFPRR